MNQPLQTDNHFAGDSPNQRRVIDEEELRRMMKATDQTLLRRNKSRVATLVLIAINVVVFAAEIALSGLGVVFNGGGISSSVLVDMGAMFLPAIQGPLDLYRFITPMFLHMSPMHLLFNMVALYSVGELLERRLGTGNFVALYFIAGITGNVLTFVVEHIMMQSSLLSGSQAALSNGFAISAGASTSVFGLFVAVALLGWLSKERNASLITASKSVLGIIGINIVFTLLVPGISITGHLGGALGGLIAMFMIPAKSLRVPWAVRIIVSILWIGAVVVSVSRYLYTFSWMAS